MSIVYINSYQFAASGVPAAITYGITNSGGTFNLRSTGTVNYDVEWGDGDAETSTLNTLPHVYIAGNYTLDVYSSGVYRPYWNNVTADASQITSVVIGSGADLGPNLQSAWLGASNMTSFVCPFDVTSSVTKFRNAWTGCNNLATFPLIDTSSGTNFLSAWNFCTNLVSFPLIDTSSGTNFDYAWGSCTNLVSFPLIDTSSGTSFVYSFASCPNLTSFPLIDVSSATRFMNTWSNDSNLTTFPANMFDTTGTLISSAFQNAWTNCALTAQSIENILVSLDTNGASNITLGIGGGTNAPRYQGTSGTTLNWSAAAEQAFNNLGTKGWSISYKSYA